MNTLSWKTTVVGSILAILVAVQPLFQTGVVNWPAVIIAALVALFSYIDIGNVEDKNIIGGDRRKIVSLRIFKK